MTEVFISDLHLSEAEPEITQGFLQFLEERLGDASSLYILGDFFELWVGDDHESEVSQRILEALRELPIPIYLMHGNRDFLLGERFCQAVGATLLPDPSVITINGEKVLLLHGDSLCTEDVEYMKVRGLLRSEAFQQDFLSKPIPERIAFAEGARQQSQAHTRETAADIMDVTPSEVVKVMEQAGVHTLIHGHTHRPAVHDVALEGVQGKRFVLGDWSSTGGWQIRAGADGIELTEFSFS